MISNVQSTCPATDYAFSVLTGEQIACKYVRLACQRFINDLSRTDIWYDRAAAENFFTYCTFLKHYKGPMKGMPIELELWQKFVFGNIYGFKRKAIATEQDVEDWNDPDESNPRAYELQRLHPEGFDVGDLIKTNLWRFRFNYIEIPRKNGKTTIAAAGASYDCAYMESTGAEVYCLATKEDQAKILWNDVKAFINQDGSDLKEKFEILEGRNTVYARGSQRTSWVKPLGANSERLDGLNPFSAYCDELHEWPDRKLLDVIEDGFGARDNWHITEITTSGHNQQGICYTERKHGIDILEGRIINDDKFCIIYTVDDEDKENWMDERVWFKANPNLGKGKQLEYMRTKAAKAAEIPSELNTFLNKQLDIWTDVAEAWIKSETWKKCQVDTNPAILVGKKCTAACDLAKVSDLSAVAYLFPIQKGLELPHLIVKFYCPKANVKTRKERDKLPYDVWIREGWITETPGDTTDFKFIEHDVVQNAGTYDVSEIAFDRTFAGEIISNLMEEGMEVVDFGQGFLSMGPPTAEFERLLVSKQIAILNNPVLDWMSGNVVIVKDPAGNMKPDKARSPEKIDGIVAAIMAQGRQMAVKKPKKKTPYNERGLRSVSG